LLTPPPSPLLWLLLLPNFSFIYFFSSPLLSTLIFLVTLYFLQSNFVFSLFNFFLLYWIKKIRISFYFYNVFTCKNFCDLKASVYIYIVVVVSNPEFTTYSNLMELTCYTIIATSKVTPTIIPKLRQSWDPHF
jgi:hypothetical protein